MEEIGAWLYNHYALSSFLHVIISFMLTHLVIKKGVRFCIVVLIIGLFKELIYDYYLGYGTASVDDMLFNGLGIIIYLIIMKGGMK